MLNLFRSLVHFLSGLMPESMRKNSLSCKEVAYILSTSDDITGPEFKRLRMHLFLCEACENYRKQLLRIKHSVKELPEVDFTPEQLARIEAQKAKLKSFK